MRRPRRRRDRRTAARSPNRGREGSQIPPHHFPAVGSSLLDLRPLSDCRSPTCARIETFIPLAQVRWLVSPEDRLQTVLRGSEEVVTREELRMLLDRTGAPRAYVGLEPSGLMHIGTAFVIGSKVEDLLRAGFHAIIFLADWHAYINDKLGRNLENLRICAEYFKDGFRAVGVPDSVEYLYANEFVRHPEYWQNVIQASKASTVARIRRALTIMGRKEEEADLDASKLIYPAMQVADIHWMDLDLALGGMDQRHAHMLYPRRGKLMIPRDTKFGGDVVYESFNELAKSYANGELHPKDLKAGVTAGLNSELVPVGKYFEAHPENLEAVQRITRAG